LPILETLFRVLQNPQGENQKWQHVEKEQCPQVCGDIGRNIVAEQQRMPPGAGAEPAVTLSLFPV
jgi:hypothetical protein